jgi:hypothetical protein
MRELRGSHRVRMAWARVLLRCSYLRMTYTTPSKEGPEPGRSAFVLTRKEGLEPVAEPLRESPLEWGNTG